jgi:integrase
MNNTPLQAQDKVEIPYLPDGNSYTAKEILAWCARYPIKPYISKAQNSGLVTFEATLGTVLDRASGKYRKIRKTFNPKKYGALKVSFEAAREWCNNHKGASQSEKADLLSIPPNVRPVIVWALEECTRQGVSLMAVVQAGFASIEQTRIKEEITFAQAAQKCIESKRDATETYRKDLFFFFRHAGRDFGDIKLHEITSEDIEEWMEDQDFSPVTWNNKLRLFRLLWNFAMEKRNGWVRENPITEIKERQVKDAGVSALTPDQAIGVLRAAQNSLPRLLPYLVLGMFCGLRRSEAQRADWSDIDWETNSIMVRVTKSKTAANRYVHLEPVAIDWLKPIARTSGPMASGKHARRDDLKEMRAMTLDFDGNIFRHSFGTYHYHGFQNPQKTQVEMGHTTVQMLHKHYRKPVPQTTAMLYWGLVREKVLAR